jgi:DegV family protein with EDD domain
MDTIGILTEETADLPAEIVEKYRISIVPIALIWPELESMPGDNTFQKMRELEKRGINSYGKTSQPSPYDFLVKFRHQMKRFGNVLCINLTSKLSGSYNSALVARSMLRPEEQQKVFFFDSLSGSGGQALFVLNAVNLINNGHPVHHVLRVLKESVNKVHLYIVFQDTRWMVASGRVPPILASVSRAMAGIGVRPVLTTRNGEVALSGLRTGARDLAVALHQQISKDTKKARRLGKRIQVAITHGDNLAGAAKLRELIERDFENVDIVFCNIINNVVGVLIGPGALSVAWCEPADCFSEDY